MLKEKDNFRKIIIRTLVVIFTLNTVIISLYSIFFLNRNVGFSIDKTKKILNQNIESIDNNLTLDKIKKIEENYDVEIQVKNLDDEVVYDSLKESNFQYTNGKMVEINGEKHFLLLSKQLDITTNLLITQLLYIELGIILIITILGYKILSKKLLIPIWNLRKDMLAYRDGIIPTKREKNTSIDELQNNFIDLTEALELEKEKQNQIIASITHDIKTPLTSIMGYAKRLETKELAKEKEIEYITKINSNVSTLSSIISEFDDYLGCNLNQTIKFERIYIKDLVVLIKEEYEDVLKEKNIKFKIKNKTQTSDFMIADINKLKRIFQNTIYNSIRYLDKPKKSIQIIITKNPNEFKIEISDNGTGLEEGLEEKIFDPLFTTDRSRKISGLGLSICKQIVKIHNGNIFAKNNKKAGLSIIFTIKSDY